MSIFTDFGAWFHRLTNEIAKEWHKLDPVLKADLIKSSTIIATLNQYVDETPAFVFEIIQKQFPDVTADNIHAILAAATKDIATASSLIADDPMVFIANIQAWLKDTKAGDNTAWEKISHTMYLGLAIYLAAPGTKIAAAVTFAEYVYHLLVKPKVVAP